ncbi:MAG: hypothetical protein Kow0068_09040 [Marinilabiliales bacterium]
MQGIPFAHIHVINKHMGKVGNADGSYALVTEVGDTIIFSSVGYKKRIFIVPKTDDDIAITYNPILIEDTIKLKTAIVYPWSTYEELKRDFITMQLVDDDVEKAFKNIAMMQKQLVENPDDFPASPNASYRLFMNQTVYDKMYYSGQSQPMKIFDIMAWAQFFEALKNGDFKYKKKKYE